MDNNNQYTLLIVDDNPTNIKVLFGFLREVGFKVLIAKNGEDALNKIENIIPDLILLDVMMPGIDGFETCKRLKENPTYQGIPIIFTTALADTDHKLKGLSLGAVDYITKPFQQEEVLARISLQLKLASLTKELAERNTQLTELNASLEQKVEERTAQLKNTQSQLIVHEKMSSLGQLVAGIAHEINNPVSFIVGNLTHAGNYAEDLINLIELYQKYYPEPVEEIAQELEELEFDYLKEDFPQVISSMQEGTKRIFEISQSMRTFSRADTDQKIKFNLHEGLDSTLLILKHRLKANQNRPAIEIIKNYGELPEIECYAGQINQVFMNILANAIDAIEESLAGKKFAAIEASPGQIMIQTDYYLEKKQVVVKIKDNGIGMTSEVQDKIFNYLYTTKAVGKGTGLGMTITWQIVEEKHGGKLDFNTVWGKGTEFAIALPL